MSEKRIVVLCVMFLFVVAACVTVNIYFPAAEVQKAADEIVGEVRGGGTDNTRTDEAPSGGGDKETMLRNRTNDFAIFVTAAYAAMDIEVTTPAIRSLKESLKNRFSGLRPFYESGRIGETNRGLIEARELQGLGLKEKSNLMRLVDDENKDRKLLYEEILKANNLGPEHMEEIQRIFSKSWQKSTPAGWWIQQEDGAWVMKK
ncbi:YdbL family protein [bacterium]|nr:YdbL family protein [bacterium]